MFTLSIETSGRLGSVALSDEGKILDERTFAHGLQHAAELIPLIDAMTKQHGVTPDQIAEIYVSAGPGSFTGLRIGITLAKTFSFTTGAKIVAVPTVKVLAENAPADAKNLIIVLDAKRGQIFTGRFHRENHEWIEDETAHLDTLVEMLARSPRPVHLLGEGIPFHRQNIGDDPAIHIVEENSWRARAAAVAKIGAGMAARGEFAGADRLIPIYVRKPEAEEKWEKNNSAV
jgi:tRNA threonylcarbamoyladenosine biosynthesis protein TsaB